MALPGRFSLSLWFAAGVLAAAVGTAVALWRAPDAVYLPIPGGAEALPPMPAPPSLARGGSRPSAADTGTGTRHRPASTSAKIIAS